MKKLLVGLLSLTFVLAFTIDATAQKKMKKGVLKYEITDIKTDIPEAEAMMGMMKGTEMNIYFNGKMQAVKMDMMGGMMKTNIITEVGNEENSTMLFDMMGRKIKIVAPAADLDKEKAKSQEMMENAEVIVDKSDTKEILGYKCHKASIKTADATLDFYITDKVAIEKSYFDEMYNGKLNGTPLEFSIAQGPINMVLTATALEKDVPSGAFDAPEGYEEMSLEEFQKSMGAMGGF